MTYHISYYDLSYIKIVMMSFTFSTNKISGIWLTPNPEKSKSEFQPIRMLQSDKRSKLSAYRL